jgi:hypothetical protein
MRSRDGVVKCVPFYVVVRKEQTSLEKVVNGK